MPLEGEHRRIQRRTRPGDLRMDLRVSLRMRRKRGEVSADLVSGFTVE
jgi:hypothetical protein